MDLTFYLRAWFKLDHVEQYTIPNLVVLVLALRVLHIVGWVNHDIVDADLLKVTPILTSLQNIFKVTLNEFDINLLPSGGP